ncbi:TonB-dependent receptor [Gelidibacter maritimus]|uniref:TonB-dependent receptor n=1 Tax=Gelidibacter maritimus TaxID=2761487 RepID=A0A7W2M5M1_9FLAO|nr:TonB-dependent receptor [Gelidibacter maritimus]MBA6153129.1 TonB-dependent receptor [Gelidibacter maritimus]
MKNFLIFSLLVFAIHSTCAQHAMASISGRVVSEDGKVMADTYVYLENTSYYVETNEIGKYRLQVPVGNYTLISVSMGFVKETFAISLYENQEIIHDFVMVADKNMILDEVRLQGKSKIQKVRETAYNVVALDAKGHYNTTTDLSSLLEKASGVKVRSTGGVGSDASISLNGFTGKHVKVFIDGVPMSGLGSAFQINNIALNIADRIEVYKGVVPIELGSDALGGAINIITNQNSNTYLDASYSYGSFNTHKSNINLGYTAASGFTSRLNVFQNYSDNSYKVKTNLLDLETNSYSKEEHWFKRFHDRYRNETAIAKVGIVNKTWADKFLFGVTIGQENADIQNANLMKIVYGGKERESSSVIPSFEYNKANLFTQGLKLSIMANYSQVRNKNRDTLARQYNWLGDYRNKTSKGEGQYSLGKFENNNGTIISNLSYRINPKHHFALNNTFSAFERKSSDAVANSETSSEADNFKRANSKNVLGASYTVAPYRQWNTSLFGKYYSVNVTGPIDISNTTTPEYEEGSRSFNSSGYGLATSYLFRNELQLKVSFEKTYRLPTTNELFGDEVLETGDASLKAEHSQNINFNMSYNYSFNQNHSLYADVGFIYRNIQDYIRRQIEQRYGGAFYTNHGQVQNVGVDIETRYYYKDNFSAGANLTYQNIRNMERYSSTGQEVIYFKDRMPNVPYFFGNLDADYNIKKLWGEGNSLSIGYASQYIHEFFRQWESEGAANSKKIIPTQWSHDISLTYSIKNGTYNISLEAKNITNEMLFDNYSLQKPGRSFAVKLRYFINNNSNN